MSCHIALHQRCQGAAFYHQGRRHLQNPLLTYRVALQIDPIAAGPGPGVALQPSRWLDLTHSLPSLHSIKNVPAPMSYSGAALKPTWAIPGLQAKDPYAIGLIAVFRTCFTARFLSIVASPDRHPSDFGKAQEGRSLKESVSIINLNFETPYNALHF